jgi:hypothetical protein
MSGALATYRSPLPIHHTKGISHDAWGVAFSPAGSPFWVNDNGPASGSVPPLQSLGTGSRTSLLGFLTPAGTYRMPN